MLVSTDRGLYCEAGDFYIDPWLPVERSVITHAHSDHAQPGSRRYLTTSDGAGVLRPRVQDDALIDVLDYGQSLMLDGVRVSLHPAGHVLGSAQVRIEHQGEVWVVSGDYKRQPDDSCRAFEPLRCHTFITESTFGLPIYRWAPPESVFQAINAWWREQQAREHTCILYAYALGKAQRLLMGLDASIGPILVHGAVERFAAAYREAGIALPATLHANAENARVTRGRALVIAPVSAATSLSGSAWLRKFAPASTAIASGWMRLRGPRRRRSVDRGFALSDHVDWPGLLTTIHETGAQRILVTHGYAEPLSRWLRERGLDAQPLATPFRGESVDEIEPDDANSDNRSIHEVPGDNRPIGDASDSP